MEQPKQKSLGVIIALLFSIVSASMAFANKAVLSAYEYNYPISLVTVQMCFTILLIESLRFFRLLEIPSFTLQRGKDFFIPSLFYAINSVLALSALSSMNIPMYGLIKRCSPIVILLLGTVILGKGLPSLLVFISVGMVTTGCIIAGKFLKTNGKNPTTNDVNNIFFSK